MRSPFRAKANKRQQTSRVVSYPAPLGGWNARDPLAAMKNTDAVTLDNWMPQTTYCEIRGGYVAHLTAVTGVVETLATYNALNGTNKLFAISSSGVYDASSPGAVGAAVAARTNGQHQQVMFGDGTNNYLILVNGVDKPLYYNGTAWVAVDGASSPALTGVTTTDIVGVNSFKGRLFFILNDSLSFWYLTAGAAGGALTEFDLSGEAKRGGHLVAMATWTRDAGDGSDDVAVFVTSEGEGIVYQGNNPSSATTWAKIGTYYIGRPMGRRSVLQYGGDLLVITENGIYPLTAALQSATIDYKMALSFKIERAFTDAARTYGQLFGWEAIVYPAQNALIVNVPINGAGDAQQFVMNTITKSWCRFTNWDAATFGLFNGELYFGESDQVARAWTGTIDGEDDIIVYGKTAFSYFGTGTQQKHVTMYRPVLAVNGDLTFLTDIDVDFKDADISGLSTYTTISGASWDAADWDEGFWASGFEIVKNWTSPSSNVGYAISGKIKISTNSLVVQWMSNDFVFESGGIL